MTTESRQKQRNEIKNSMEMDVQHPQTYKTQERGAKRKVFITECLYKDNADIACMLLKSPPKVLEQKEASIPRNCREHETN